MLNLFLKYVRKGNLLSLISLPHVEPVPHQSSWVLIVLRSDSASLSVVSKYFQNKVHCHLSKAIKFNYWSVKMQMLEIWSKNWVCWKPPAGQSATVGRETMLQVKDTSLEQDKWENKFVKLQKREGGREDHREYSWRSEWISVDQSFQRNNYL